MGCLNDLKEVLIFIEKIKKDSMESVEKTKKRIKIVNSIIQKVKSIDYHAENIKKVFSGKNKSIKIINIKKEENYQCIIFDNLLSIKKFYQKLSIEGAFNE